MEKITLIGMYNFDNTLFDNMKLPEGIDKDTLIENILLQGGEFEPLYIDPDFIKFSIGTWSKKWYRTIEKWIKALNIEYNPLENYDRFEDYTDESSGNVHAKSTDKGTSKTTGGNTTENSVSAYDSSEYQPSAKSKLTYDNETTASDGSSDGTSESKGTLKHTARLHGNIGVTTSQQMLQSELDIARFNLYDEVTNLFLTENVLLVY